MKRPIICGAMLLCFATLAIAQGGTNSPYSQYGLGMLSDRSQGFSRGMNGAGVAVRKGNIVNTLNPASYSAVDSLTMMFDVGLSGQFTNYKEGGERVNASSANFEYAVGSFRLLPNVGMAFGVLPLTNVGYSYSTKPYSDDANGTITQTFSGSGGLHEAFIGAGWRPVKPLSVGLHIGYLWGSVNRSVTSSSTSSYVGTLNKTYSASVSSYNLQLGAQWEQQVDKQNMLTLGATASVGHKLGADPVCQVGSAAVADTVSNGFELPMTYALGISWNHAGKLLVAADVSLQKWGSLSFPDYNETTGRYASVDGLLKDRKQFTMGLNYVPEAMSRNYLKRVHYRFGAGWATPYYKINGADGPKEFSLSAGFGLPLQNMYNNRSILNISAQWVRASAKNMITENTFRINVGLTFNERWFMKWKVE